MNPKSTKERKKILKENDFLIFDFTLENIKENQICSKFYIFLNFLVLYIIEGNR